MIMLGIFPYNLADLIVLLSAPPLEWLQASSRLSIHCGFELTESSFALIAHPVHHTNMIGALIIPDTLRRSVD